ncbi:MAG: energy transducer TonB [Prevotella sp.]|nr:energy transducer TonB [Prevotella sp.]
MKSNYYQEYEYSGILEYFDPSKEDFVFTPLLYTIHLTYDKTKKRYSCKYNNDAKIIIEFAVDNKGLRKWEIVYDKNNKPEFINEFTWYSNGIIESVKSYYYRTKKIYLSCNFFSDGTLRSAYQYGPGNSGENILRKSKESHPTYGGFTCKLYDLNGQYERSIRWSIGEALLGGSRQYTLSKFDFDKLKPIVQESDDLVPKTKEKIIEEEGQDNKDYDNVEQMPEYPGGQAALLKYLAKNIKYPVVAEGNGIQGRVIVTFVVERDGSITDVKVVKSVDPSLDEEALRVVKAMPKWKPGMINGKPVRVKETVPVQFKLQ